MYARIYECLHLYCVKKTSNIYFSFTKESLVLTISKGRKLGLLIPESKTACYSLSSELLVAGMDVSRRILILHTSISKTSNSERREYYLQTGNHVLIRTRACIQHLNPTDRHVHARPLICILAVPVHDPVQDQVPHVALPSFPWHRAPHVRMSAWGTEIASRLTVCAACVQKHLFHSPPAGNAGMQWNGTHSSGSPSHQAGPN